MTNRGGAIAGLLAIAAIASAQSGSVLTIDDAVALALKGNREVQSAALDVYRARQQSAALKTTRLPQFQIYVLSGELLRQVSFTVPQGSLGLRGHRTDSRAESDCHRATAVCGVRAGAGYAASVSALENPSGVDLVADR
jgi:hypothetical protein